MSLGSPRNAAYSTVRRAAPATVDAAVARTPKFTARPSTTARTLVVDAAAATCFAVRIAARELGDDVTVLTPSSIDFERLVSRIPRLSYEVLRMERQNRLTTLAGAGAQVIDWMPDMDLAQALMQVRGY